MDVRIGDDDAENHRDITARFPGSIHVMVQGRILGSRRNNGGRHLVPRLRAPKL